MQGRKNNMNKDRKIDCIIIQNIISPYKTLLFNTFKKNINNELTFKVLYLAETENIREWKIDKKGIKFPYEVLFKGSINTVNAIKMVDKIYKKMNCYNPEIIIIGGYNYFAYWAALIWVKIHKKKIVVIIESHYLDKSRTMIKETVKRLFVSNCDGALVDGIRHKKYAISLGLKAEKVFIKKGTGPVDVLWYQREVSKHKKDKIDYCKKLNISYKNFLYVGRFSPEKNIICLLKCFRKLQREEVTDWGIILVGNGPQKREIESFINKNKIKNVFLPGFRQKEEIPFYYALSDCFILPSTSEPWGLVVSEAMACGLPVLVSNRCGCYPDIVHDGENGFSFDPFNEEELIEFLKNITQGKYNLEIMGKTSLKIIMEYTPEKSAEIIKNAIISIIPK